ncbi:ATPase/histidine kinase/DNA gyrase B/HSP90 domain protein [Candidatus Nitrosarchaeum limnium BG20]|uniref:ATPase/histidine kinase/DNA gyrase B/HSP90 domain protein n=2 Tax=Nitrosarchaeum TaxID=1007082 RepID=S2E7F1_9ARCH|nr:ATPase/histidine kinase/DNA gyrase B/HSP90 domain protein [Candidatus Nitrosarchaeum limnium BG20]
MKAIVKVGVLMIMQISVMIFTTNYLLSEGTATTGRFELQGINQVSIENISQDEKFDSKFNKLSVFGYDGNFFIIINVASSFAMILGVVTLLKIETKKKIQTEKMAIVGEMASRIGHDIRNPLSVIQMSIENLKRTYEINEQQQKQFDKIQRAIFRISHQMDDVMDFVKAPTISKKQCSLISMLEESVKRIKIPENIKIIFPEKDTEVLCDEEKITIVFVNMMLNAIQSLESGGTITISAKSNKKEVMVKIEDNGIGIKPEILKRVFEPLVTTKQSGTGLGLSSCKSIIDSHGGFIEASNKFEKGAIFCIHLPNRGKGIV